MTTPRERGAPAPGPAPGATQTRPLAVPGTVPIRTKSVNAVLLVEDNPGDARLLREMLNDQSSQVTELTTVSCMGEAEALLAEREVDIIVVDLDLRDAQGLEAIRRAHAIAPRIPLVVLTGLDDERLAAQALQEGAQDYLLKDQIETRGLLRALRYAVERKAMEEALFVEKERALVTLNCIGDAVVCTNVSGEITFLNKVAEKMTGWSLSEASGKPMPDVIRVLDATSRVERPNPMQLVSSAPSTAYMSSRCVLIRRDKLEIPIEDSIAPIHDRDGRTTGAVVVLRDVSASRAMALQMTHSAEHDFLTGLPNRMLLNERVRSAIALARHSGRKVAVLFLDLDGFKHTNDSLGHPTGDKLLRSIAARLVDCVRSSDTVSRQGGDEFVVLLSEVEAAHDAAVTARRMLRAVAEAHSVDDHDLHVTTSIGVSVYPEDGLDADTLIKNADTAMYQAKEDGRQSYKFFKPAMNVRAVERQSIEESLRRALERDEFMLHYQPKVDLRSGAITGAEALLRWNHPTRGPVPPAQFIPVAEDCGLILAIGNWVLRTACAQAQAWIVAGLPRVNMAVNVSAMEFWNENFLHGLFTVLSDTGLHPGSLGIELTETVLMKRVESTATILQSLRDRGVQVAVDDFGTGYSSLSYLRKFPVDALKIDQSFIREITAGPDEASMVSAVLTMARSLRLRVVAEGVEVAAEVEFLRSHQCDEAQGFFFSAAVPAQQFARLLTNGFPIACGRPIRKRASGSDGARA